MLRLKIQLTQEFKNWTRHLARRFIEFPCRRTKTLPGCGPWDETKKQWKYFFSWRGEVLHDTVLNSDTEKRVWKEDISCSWTISWLGIIFSRYHTDVSPLWAIGVSFFSSNYSQRRAADPQRLEMRIQGDNMLPQWQSYSLHPSPCPADALPWESPWEDTARTNQLIPICDFFSNLEDSCQRMVFW